jgi:hypothetical protein
VHQVVVAVQVLVVRIVRAPAQRVDEVDGDMATNLLEAPDVTHLVTPSTLAKQ